MDNKKECPAAPRPTILEFGLALQNSSIRLSLADGGSYQIQPQRRHLVFDPPHPEMGSALAYRFFLVEREYSQDGSFSFGVLYARDWEGACHCLGIFSRYTSLVAIAAMLNALSREDTDRYAELTIVAIREEGEGVVVSWQGGDSAVLFPMKGQLQLPDGQIRHFHQVAWKPDAAGTFATLQVQRTEEGRPGHIVLGNYPNCAVLAAWVRKINARRSLAPPDTPAGD